MSCRCGAQPAKPLAYGCFPGTPVASPCIDRNWKAPPVWLDAELLEFIKTLQCCGKGEPSDYSAASAVISMHQRLDPDMAAASQLKVHALNVKLLARYLSAGLKARGALEMQLEHDMKCAMHPPDQPGHLIANCPICAEGADDALLDSLLPAASDSAAEQTEGADQEDPTGSDSMQEDQGDASQDPARPVVRPTNVRC